MRDSDSLPIGDNGNLPAFAVGENGQAGVFAGGAGGDLIGAHLEIVRQVGNHESHLGTAFGIDGDPLHGAVELKAVGSIIAGELAPGERLMEIRLANMLGVSRTPIREAIRKLELEGLVNMIPRRGAEVAGISEKSLRDVLEVRRSLEELAMDLAVQRMNEEQMKLLEDAQAEFVEALGTNDLILIAQADENFHDMIYGGKKNEKLVQMLNNLRDQMYRYRLEYIKDVGKRQILKVEHERMMDSLKRRDRDLAKRIAREHIDNQEITIMTNLNIK